MAFDLEHVDGRSLVDGSLHTTVAIGEPIERCREEGYKDEDIIIDILMCYTGVYDVESWDLEGTRWMNAFDFYQRRKSITHYYFYKEDMVRMFRGYKDIDFRLTVMPESPLTGGVIPLSANADDVANAGNTANTANAAKTGNTAPANATFAATHNDCLARLLPSPPAKLSYLLISQGRWTKEGNEDWF